ncbi:MAG: alpha/beta hydrolase [Candidatus Thiodiazotropha sp. (ex Semelilucina semeliformis)]|nr:alpha/beta hydrolase [Candidatus Thiodiazotropha sp. (ex Semelilucina semeliformis)]
MTDWNLTETYTFEDRYVKFGVVGERPPVIVVHGTPWSSCNMRHIIEALSDKYTTYYFDLIGYGQSDKSNGDVSLGIQNTILDRLIKFWGLKKPAVIGYDFGGATVLRAHLLNKQDFAKIVLIDPVSISPWGSPFFQHVKAHEDAFTGVPDYIHEAIVRAYINTAAYTPLSDDTMDKTIQPWMGKDGQAAFYRQIAQAKEEYTDEVQSVYSQITMSLMILWGTEDNWILVERGRLLQQLIPDALFFEIPNTGHLVIEERPDLLLEKIRPF